MSGEGLTPHPAFDNACAELGGHFPIKTREAFVELTGDIAIEMLNKSALPSEEFEKISEFLSTLI